MCPFFQMLIFLRKDAVESKCNSALKPSLDSEYRDKPELCLCVFLTGANSRPGPGLDGWAGTGSAVLWSKPTAAEGQD